MKLTAEESLKRAATALFLQAYGNKHDGSHAPTIMQWLMLGAALSENDVTLPPDWEDAFAPRTAVLSPDDDIRNADWPKRTRDRAEHLNRHPFSTKE
jgi:hypothetical protein